MCDHVAHTYGGKWGRVGIIRNQPIAQLTKWEQCPMPISKITAPFTEEQVKALNAYQKRGQMHPFTCPEGGRLVATTNGWVCIATHDRINVCTYEQDWAHDFMAEGPEGTLT